MVQIWSPARVRTYRQVPWLMPVGAAQVGPEGRLAVGSRRHEVEPAAGAEQVVQKRATTSRPWYSKGIGGIEMKTSSVSTATSVDIGGLPCADESGHERLLGR
jgi:hypothetical protein